MPSVLQSVPLTKYWGCNTATFPHLLRNKLESGGRGERRYGLSVPLSCGTLAAPPAGKDTALKPILVLRNQYWRAVPLCVRLIAVRRSEGTYRLRLQCFESVN